MRTKCLERVKEIRGGYKLRAVHKPRPFMEEFHGKMERSFLAGFERIEQMGKTRSEDVGASSVSLFHGSNVCVYHPLSTPKCKFEANTPHGAKMSTTYLEETS